MAEEREGLPPNPAQMMRDKNKAAADKALAGQEDRRQDLFQNRVGSMVRGAQDEKAFTPDDEPLEMEGAVAPKVKPTEKKAAPKPKSFRGKGDF